MDTMRNKIMLYNVDTFLDILLLENGLLDNRLTPANLSEIHILKEDGRNFGVSFIPLKKIFLDGETVQPGTLVEVSLRGGLLRYLDTQQVSNVEKPITFRHQEEKYVETVRGTYSSIKELSLLIDI